MNPKAQTKPDSPPEPAVSRAPVDTKERLVEAGMHVFAERGFRAASIREICTRAKANPAAVNYHFGDKERFYAEVLVTIHQRAVRRRHMPVLGDDPDRPEEVLKTWIRWFLEMLLVEASSNPLGKMMTREMFQPTAAFDDLIRRSVFPMMEGLRETVEAFLGDVTPMTARLATYSILGQCLLYKHVQPAFERMQNLVDRGELPPPGPVELSRDLDALAHHIAEFSLAGLARIRSGASGDAA